MIGVYSCTGGVVLSLFRKPKDRTVFVLPSSTYKVCVEEDFVRIEDLVSGKTVVILVTKHS